MKVKEMKRKRKYSFIIIFSIVACLCYLIMMWVHLQMNINERKVQLNNLSSELTQQVEENKSLDNEVKNGISDEEKERIARDELGYVMPGEHVYADASAGD